jgi:hypothetical protein
MITVNDVSVHFGEHFFSDVSFAIDDDNCLMGKMERENRHF